jgi:hypothetical protein
MSWKCKEITSTKYLVVVGDSAAITGSQLVNYCSSHGVITTQGLNDFTGIVIK